MLADLDKASTSDTAAKTAYQGYLKHYRACLAEQQVQCFTRMPAVVCLKNSQSRHASAFSCLQVDKLEPMWAELDRLWMEVKYWIQIVHDIEV